MTLKVELSGKVLYNDLAHVADSIDNQPSPPVQSNLPGSIFSY